MIKRSVFKKFKEDTAACPTAMAVSVTLHLLVIICLIGALISKDMYSAYFCILALALFRLPAVAERFFGIHFTPFIKCLILFFIFAAEILGEMCYLYGRISVWDVILHFISGFMFGAFGVALFERLNKRKFNELGLSPAFLVIAVIGFSVFVGVLWEFFEFGCDNWLKTDMQKDNFVDSIYSVTLDHSGKNHTARIYGIRNFSVKGIMYEGGYLDIGLIDTMKDLAVNFAGAITFGIILLTHLKNKAKNKFTSFFIYEKTAE